MAATSGQYQRLWPHRWSGVNRPWRRRPAHEARAPRPRPPPGPARAAGRGLARIGHEAAVDPHDAAGRNLERRVDVPAEPGWAPARRDSAPCRGGSGPSAVTCRYSMSPPARQRARRVGERHGLGVDAGGDLGDQAFLPALALELPGAEPDQHGKAGERQQRRPDQPGPSQPLPASRASLSRGRSGLRRPCACTAARSASLSARAAGRTPAAASADPTARRAPTPADAA